MTDFDDHRWACERHRKIFDRWWWKVRRDNVLVGLISAANDGCLNASDDYEAYTVSCQPIPPRPASRGTSSYTAALQLIHETVPVSRDA